MDRNKFAFILAGVFVSSIAFAQTNKNQKPEGITTHIKEAIRYLKPRSLAELTKESYVDYGAKKLVHLGLDLQHFFTGNANYQGKKLATNAYFGSRSMARSLVSLYSPIYFSLKKPVSSPEFRIIQLDDLNHGLGETYVADQAALAEQEAAQTWKPRSLISSFFFKQNTSSNGSSKAK